MPRTRTSDVGASSRTGRRALKLEPIEYVNLTDRVYRAIKERILSQDIEVGSRLRDEDLVAQLGVSRTPVREAIMRLAQEGLVDVVPRSGTYVRSFTKDDIEEIWDLRVALEALAVRRAAMRLDVQEVERLRAMHREAEAALQTGRTKLVLAFDQEMHRVILHASGNRRLQEAMGRINDLVELFRNIGARTPFHRGYTYRHREILEALERRDAAAAAQALAEHIEMSKRELFRDFEQRKNLEAARPARPARRSRTVIRTPNGSRPRPQAEHE
jgi:DNA-binding GntR family transcriptional regulator